MKAFHNLVLTSCLILPSTAGATQDIGYIKSIFVFSGSYGFTLDKGFENAASDYQCEASWGFAQIPAETDGNSNSREMYSSILASMAAGKKVKINTDGCIGNHFKVSGIYVENN